MFQKPTLHAAPVIPGAIAVPTPARPALQSERLVILDILRGIALLGMLMVHVNYYEATPLGSEPGAAAAFVERTLGLFFEERFYGIFGMLFGVGFALQLERADARNERFAARYLRRLAALAVFGLVAEGVFGFNVLLGYAIWGVPLLVVRRWSVRSLVVLLVLCTAARPIYSVARLAAASTQPGGAARFIAAQRASADTYRAAYDSLRVVERSGDWSAVVRARIAHIPKFHSRFGFLPNMSFVLFLLGLLAYRLGYLTRPREHGPAIVLLATFGVAATLVGTFVLPLGGPIQPPSPTDPPVWSAVVRFARFGFQLIRPQWLAFTYIGMVLLLVANSARWSHRLSWFAPAGRMALTNYLTQVVLLELCFTPHGLGLAVPAALVFPAAIAIFVAQVRFSSWWLSRFRFGPMEWFWRSVTNWNVEPVRREEERPAAALVA
ncbi:MAG TPA: DUF418 domain-containing protein [Gemmatimonadaceae bacterium]